MSEWLIISIVVWISYGRMEFSDKSILLCVDTELTVAILIFIDLSS